MKVKFQQAILLIVMVLGGCLPQTGEERVLVGNVQEYRLGAGDQIRVLVFEQATLSNVYTVDASGKISVPLVGTIKASNRTTRQLEADIAGQLKERDLVTDPKVAVEVAAYRPFSILGEVRNPGRFPYAPGMTIESAIALAGGYTIHADKDQVRVTRRMGNEAVTETLPPSNTFAAGDTITVRERWY
jgi:polysaccharide export outer membrane protein